MNWQADEDKNWNRISRWLLTSPPDPNLGVLVLAAHPDDETIGASLLLSRFPQSTVAFLTDGAPRDTSLWSAGINGSRDDYAGTRKQEAVRALHYTEVSAQRVFWLEAVDQEAAFEMSALAHQFANLLAEICPAIVVTHPYEGGHPDHDCAAVVARIAIATALLDHKNRPVLLEMTSYHARDGQCVTGEFLRPGSSPEMCFEFSPSDRERKRNMMDAYASQRLVLEHFSIDQERLRLAPEYNFSEPPHEGKLWYECMGWPMTGGRWRELATSAIAEAQEHSCL
jgi:LmbE family N-acetylglucosaminyl deacetylase